VRFEGNEAFSDRKLISLMTMRPPSVRRPFSRSYYLRDLLVANDLPEIRKFYADHGYLNFRVVDIAEERDPERATVRLRIEIEEGPVTVVGGITFDGLSVFTPGSIRREVRLRPGGPLSPFVLDGDVERIRARYSAEGYLFANVSREVVVSEHRADVTFRIREGPPAVLRHVAVHGNATTQSHDITRELTLHPGDRMRREAVERSQRRLSDLGLFSFVRLQPIAVDSVAGVVDLSVEVREREHGYYGFGLGFASTERARVSAQWGHRNVWGTVRRVGTSGAVAMDVDSIVTRGADKDLSELSIQATWVEPWLLGTRTEGSFSVFHEFERQPSAFDVRSTGLRATFRRELSRWVNLFVTLENEWVHSPGDTTLSDPDYGTRSVHLITERDTRDNILDPRRGSFQRLTLQGAAVEGSQNFMKTLVSHSKAVPARPPRTRRLAYRLEAGYIHPLTTDDTRDRLDAVPVRDRFYIGGSTTLRGYEQEEVGPVDEKQITRGGTVMFLANVEYRFPIVWRVGGGVFVDAGNIWGDPRDLKLRRLTGEFTGTFSRLDVRYSAGVGLRVQTPVGPFRVDLGHKLGAGRLEFKRHGRELYGKRNPEWELHFSLGHAF
jgi:outer membrane protein insertion porin family